MLPKFNSNSNDHLSLLFYGGDLIIEVVKPQINSDGTLCLIKSGINRGNIKVHKVCEKVSIKGLGITPKETWKTKKTGIYQTNKEVLLFIAKEVDDEI